MAPTEGPASRRHRAVREGEPPQGVDGTRRAEARSQAAKEGWSCNRSASASAQHVRP